MVDIAGCENSGLDAVHYEGKRSYLHFKSKNNKITKENQHEKSYETTPMSIFKIISNLADILSIYVVVHSFRLEITPPLQMVRVTTREFTLGFWWRSL